MSLHRNVHVVHASLKAVSVKIAQWVQTNKFSSTELHKKIIKNICGGEFCELRYKTVIPRTFSATICKRRQR